MQIVKPHEEVCLLLDAHYMPIMVCSAKASFYYLLKANGRGIDAVGRHFTLDDALKSNLTLHENHPLMRSAHKAWPIPTIMVLNRSFFYRKRKQGDGRLSIVALHKHYRGICMKCGKHVPLRDASADHVMPRSLSGPDSNDNIVLMHKKCNQDLGNQHPRFDDHGVPIVNKIKKVYATGFVRPDDDKMRKEWAAYLFL